MVYPGMDFPEEQQSYLRPRRGMLPVSSSKTPPRPTKPPPRDHDWRCLLLQRAYGALEKDADEALSLHATMRHARIHELQSSMLTQRQLIARYRSYGCAGNHPGDQWTYARKWAVEAKAVDAEKKLKTAGDKPEVPITQEKPLPDVPVKDPNEMPARMRRVNLFGLHVAPVDALIIILVVTWFILLPAIGFIAYAATH